jgi:hypothetical protein
MQNKARGLKKVVITAWSIRFRSVPATRNKLLGKMNLYNAQEPYHLRVRMTVKILRSRFSQALAIVTVLSLLVVVVVIATEPVLSSAAGESTDVCGALGNRAGTHDSGGTIIWDNGMDYYYLLLSQNDTTGNETWQTILADDFVLTDPWTTVTDVHWLGGYWNEPKDGDFDWEIKFCEDAGTENRPGTVTASFYFPNSETHETFRELDHNGSEIYDYSVDLPTPLKLSPNKKYWISIQGFGDWENESGAMSGWASHNETILLHEAVFKSADFGYPEWTATSNVSGLDEAYDMCFQLTTRSTVPAVAPVGIVFLLALLATVSALTIRRK